MFDISTQFTGENGFYSYYEICEKIEKEKWTVKYDDVYEVPYAYSDTEWVGFDNEKSMKKKVKSELLNSF